MRAVGLAGAQCGAEICVMMRFSPVLYWRKAGGELLNKTGYLVWSFTPDSPSNNNKHLLFLFEKSP